MGSGHDCTLDGVSSMRALRAQQRPTTTIRHLWQFGHIGLSCVCMHRPASCLYCYRVCSCLRHCIVLALSRCVLWLRSSCISSPVLVFGISSPSCSRKLLSDIIARTPNCNTSHSSRSDVYVPAHFRRASTSFYRPPSPPVYSVFSSG